MLQLWRTLSPKALTRSLRRRAWRDSSGSGSSASRPTAWRRWRPSPPSKADLPANKRGSRAARSRARSGRADLVDPKRAERDGKPRAEAARGGRK